MNGMPPARSIMVAFGRSVHFRKWFGILGMLGGLMGKGPQESQKGESEGRVKLLPLGMQQGVPQEMQGGLGGRQPTQFNRKVWEGAAARPVRIKFP